MRSCQVGHENCKPKCKPTTRHAVASDNTNQDSNSSSAMTRRCALAGAGAVLAATLFPFASSGAAPQAANTPKAMSPAEALDRLVQGNARYAAGEGKARDFCAFPGRSDRRPNPDRRRARLVPTALCARNSSSIRAPASCCRLEMPAMSLLQPRLRAWNMPSPISAFRCSWSSVIPIAGRSAPPPRPKPGFYLLAGPDWKGVDARTLDCYRMILYKPKEAA